MLSYYKIFRFNFNTFIIKSKICKKDGKNRGVYYSMTFYVRFGILSRYIDIEIAGETRLIDVI